MNNFVGELIGTAILIILGDGVVAGVLLAKSKAQNSGWIVITAGWAFAVTVAVYAVGQFTGAHINPAVTVALAVNGVIAWGDTPLFFAGQFLGAFIGAVIVWLHYLPHWAETEDPGLKLAVFSTGPAIRNPVTNIISEIIGTFVLVFGVLAIAGNEAPTAAGLTPLLVGFLVFGIGLSLGGPTGYAINPARDLGPRIAHAVLPIAGKGSSDWEYSWVPVVGPVIGGALGAVAYTAFFTNMLMV
jgi:glycerol uptake facilitator protein